VSGDSIVGLDDLLEAVGRQVIEFSPHQRHHATYGLYGTVQDLVGHENEALVIKATASGDFTGGDADNVAVLRTYYVVEPVIAEPVAASACSEDVWSDDFESSTLAAKYDTVTDMEQAAGIGVGGSQGIRGTGSDSEKFYAEIQKDMAAESRLFCITLTVKPDTGIYQSGGWYYLEQHGYSNGIVFGLYSTNLALSSSAPGDMYFYTDAIGTNDFELLASITADAENTIHVEGETSSISGGSRQADGWVKVRVNNVLILDESGLVFGDYHATFNPDNWALGILRVSPQGVGDNLLVRK
jgi:hypothetical protein